MASGIIVLAVANVRVEDFPEILQLVFCEVNFSLELHGVGDASVLAQFLSILKKPLLVLAHDVRFSIFLLLFPVRSKVFLGLEKHAKVLHFPQLQHKNKNKRPIHAHQQRHGVNRRELVQI